MLCDCQLTTLSCPFLLLLSLILTNVKLHRYFLLVKNKNVIDLVKFLIDYIPNPSPLSRSNDQDFPDGAVVKNPPDNAGDTGSSPGPRRSHMLWSNSARAPQVLSLCSRARKPQLLSPRAQSPCSTKRETTTRRSPRTTVKSSPRSPQLEKPHVQQ